MTDWERLEARLHWLRYPMLGAALVVFAALSALLLPALTEKPALRLAAPPLTLLYALAVFLLLGGARMRRTLAETDLITLFGLLAVPALALLARAALFPAVPAETGLTAAFLPAPFDVYAVALFAALCDCALACFAMRLVSLRGGGRFAQSAAFFTALLLPNFLLCGALWGRLESLPAALLLAGLYYGQARRAWLARTLLLAALVGTAALFWPFDAAQGAAAPNAYALLPAGTENGAFAAASCLFLALACALALACLLAANKRRLGFEARLTAAYLAALALPFLLPGMPASCYLLADALACVYLFTRPARWYLPAVSCACSAIGCASHFFGASGVPQWLLSLGVLAVACLLARSLLALLAPSGEGASGKEGGAL